MQHHGVDTARKYGAAKKGKEQTTLSAVIGLATTPLHELLSALDKTETPNCLWEENTSHNSAGQVMVFIGVPAFRRALPSLPESAKAIILDGPLSLLSINNINMLDVAIAPTQEIRGCVPLHPDLMPILPTALSAGPVAIEIAPCDFGLLAMESMSGMGIYSKIITVVFNNSDPAIQDELTETFKDFLLAEKMPSSKVMTKRLLNLGEKNPTRSAFIERATEALYTPEGVTLAKLLREAATAQYDTARLWEIEQSNSLPQGDLVCLAALFGLLPV